MGIREHFTEQEEKEAKLSDFSLDVEGKKEPFFDVEKEITDENWENMVESLLQLLEQSNYSRFLRMALHMKVVRPDRFMEIKFEERAMDGLREWFEQSRPNLEIGDKTTLLHYMACFKLVFTDLELRFDEQAFFQDFLDAVKREGENSAKQFCSRASDLKIVFPSGFDELNFLTEQDKRNILDEVENTQDQFSRFLLIDIMFLAQAKVLFGELEIDPRYMSLWIEALDFYKKRKMWDSFVYIAFCLKILLTDRINVTENMLKFIKPKKDFKAERKPRPERKSF